MSQQEPKPNRSNPPLPPRDRPLLGEMTREGKEDDLWDLDNGVDASVDGATAGAADASSSRLPEPKKVQKSAMIRRASDGAARQDKPQQKAAGQSSGVSINVRSKGGSGKSEMERAAERKVEREFDELDDWEEELGNVRQTKADLLVSPAIVEETVLEDIPSAQMDPDEAGPVQEVVGESASASSEFADGVDGQFGENQSSEPKPSVPINGIERVGLVVLAVILIALASGAYYWSLHQLPKEDHGWGSVSFPVDGRLFKVTGAESYWRAPVLEGENADRVRRGTQLIPVVELDVTGGPAALRVRFRDHDRNLVGDTVTRRVSSAGKIVVAATVGFEDTGMHAAYRTGQLEPWTVEVFEAGSVDAPGGEYTMIFEMKLSSELR